MSIKLIELAASDLVRKHLGNEWSLEISRAKRRHGRCYFRRKVIELSRYHLSDWKDTVLHEIAHGIAGPSAGHGVEWKVACLSIGARPEQYGPEDKSLYRWHTICTGCLKVSSRNFNKRPDKTIQKRVSACCELALVQVKSS